MNIVRWRWQSGDGQESAEKNPVFTYSAPGTYTWRLDVWDAYGNTDSTTGTITVTVPTAKAVRHSSLAWKIGVTQARDGYGACRVSGAAWPVVNAAVPPLRLLDTSGIPHLVVLDNRTGKYVSLSPRRGADGSGLLPTRKDREGVSKAITGVTLSGSDAVLISCASHGFADGDTVEFRDVGGTTELNNTEWTVDYVNASSFRLLATNSSAFTAYTSGGYVFKAGTEVTPSVEFAEDQGELEHFRLAHLASHVYVHPDDEDNRGAAGYTDEGLPEDAEFSLALYKDGEVLTADAEAADVPVNGDIGFDRETQCNRAMLKFSASAGGHVVRGRASYYQVVDSAAAPSTLSWQDYQKSLSAPSLWVGWLGTNLINRLTGAVLTTVTATQTTGPDGRTTTGINIRNTQTFPSVTLAGGAFYVWSTAALTVTIGGTAVTLVSVTTSGQWTLYKATSVTASGALAITVPTGTWAICDPRAYSSALDADTLAYYHADVLSNSGHNTIPR